MARPKCPVSRKPRFPSQLECDLAIVNIERTNKVHRRQKFREEPCRSYKCEYCNGWHMTSSS